MYNLLPFINSTGISCPLFSLRYEDDFGIGDIKGGYKFVDFLSNCGLNLWKVLPLNETTGFNNYSPYDPVSAFAFDKLYIDITSLEDIDYRRCSDYLDMNRMRLHQNTKIDYDPVKKFKAEILRIAFDSFYNNQYLLRTDKAKDFQDYVNLNYEWIYDYSLYKIFRDEYKGLRFDKWPEEIRKRNRNKLVEYKEKYSKEMLYYQYSQWIWHKQWCDLKLYANAKGVYILGDVPFYVGLNSCDVWTHPEIFDVDEDLIPKSFGGTPPDNFSSEGQIWKVATYKWDKLKIQNYSWWMNRLEHLSIYFDGLRLDHFNGFSGFWNVSLRDARKELLEGPGMDLLNKVIIEIQDKRLCPLIAENLGVYNQKAENIRKELDIDGYVVFTFNYKDILEGLCIYENNIESITHDLPPLKIWWKELPVEEKKYVVQKLNTGFTETDSEIMSDNIRWAVIKKIASLPYSMKLFAIQDIIGVDDIINIPNTTGGNWLYRIDRNIEDLNKDKILIQNLKENINNLTTINENGIQKNNGVRILPSVVKNVKRCYKLNHTIYVWALGKENQSIKAVTNINSQNSEEIQELEFKKVAVYKRGALYNLMLKSDKAGEYFITVKVDGNYIGEYGKDLKIVVE